MTRNIHIFLLLALLSCEKMQMKKYTYIEIVQEKYLTDKLVEKGAKIIEAKDDTSAYLEAYEDFCISRLSRSMISDAMRSAYDSTLHFKLLTGDGKNLVETISFPNKVAREAEIQKSVASLGMTSSENQETPGVTSGKNIPGLKPVDVYLNMEKKGFETKKIFGDLGNTWENHKTISGVNYGVDTYSSDVNSVEAVRATADASPPNEIEEAKQFFKFVVSLPYTNSNPTGAGEWVDANYSKAESDTVIGGVYFSLKAPTKYARLLRLSKFKL